MTSADLMTDGDGRQYHIGACRGDLADRLLFLGDPERVDRALPLLSDVTRQGRHREFRFATGRFEGRHVSLLGTGIGCDNMEIAVIETCQIVDQPVIIRVGTTGSLQKEVNNGDLVISLAAVRLENTSTFFVPEGYPAYAHYEVVQALVDEAKGAGVPWHAGITASASGFYGAQGRKVPGFPPRRPELLDELAGLNVLNFEMEASTLFTLASVRGFRSGSICAVYANRPLGTVIREDLKGPREETALRVGLRALAKLA